jgi:hypothetical protein
MKRYFVVLLFFSTFIVYALDSFDMNELFVSDLIHNNDFFEKIKEQLLIYLQDNNEYIKEIDNNNFNYIFELSNEKFEKIFLFIYMTGYIFREYYAIFVVTSNDAPEIKYISITNIERNQEPILPFDIIRRDSEVKK